MTRINRRAALTLTFTSAVAALSACAAIPTDGEVNHYADPRASGAATGGAAAPAGPEPGATPQQIIEGFIHAGTGVADDYSVARLYLTNELAQSWVPDSQTLVYNTAVTVEESGTDAYRVTVPVATRIDGRGLATSYTELNETELAFSLQQVEGEWRIAAAPNGTVLDRSEFSAVFNPFTLYYYDPTFSHAVPDIRWFAERSTVATSLVRVLVEGPAPYLEGAVASAVPEGTSLAQNSVPVEGEVALVQLAGGSALETATPLQLERLRTQLTQTLSNLATVTSVELNINNQVIAAQSIDNYREPVVRSAVPDHVVGIEGNKLVVRSAIAEENGQVTVFEAAPGATLTYPAMNYTRSFFAALNGDATELTLASSTAQLARLYGAGLLAPSFDHQNWLWSAEAGGRVRVLLAGQNDAEPVTLSATWLEGAQVLSFVLARDGARAVVVTSGSGGQTVWVSAVRRDEDGTPRELLKPVQLGAEVEPSGAEWSTDTEIILWNAETGEVEQVSLTGESSTYNSLKGVSRIVTGSGMDQALATTKDGAIYRGSGGSWSRLETSLSYVNYSG